MLFFLFLFPTVLTAFADYYAQPFFKTSGMDTFFTVRYFISFLAAGILPYYYFCRLFRKHFKAIVIGTAFLRYFSAYTLIASVYLTKSIPNPSVYLAVFDTNFKEALDFLQTVPVSFFILSPVYAATGVFLTRKTYFEDIKRQDFKFDLLCFIIFTAFAIITQYENNIAVRSVKAYNTYAKIKKIAKKTSKATASTPVPIVFPDPKTKLTIVVVIGESQTRAVFLDHLQDLKERTGNQFKNITVLKNAETFATGTSAVIDGILLPSVSEDKKDRFNLLSFYSSAGFRTFWLSNQFKCGLWDDLIYVVNKPADIRRYYNHVDLSDSFELSSSSNDAVLIPALESALKDTADKKFIFLHFIGSHFPLKNRYPKGFHSPLIPEKNEDEYTTRDRYANSAAYTNDVLSKLIKTLNDAKTPSALVYFSDHGDIPENPLSRSFESIKDVPVLFWLSDGFPKVTNKNLNCINAFSLKQIPYVLNKLAGLEIKDFSVAPELKQCFTEVKK